MEQTEFGLSRELKPNAKCAQSEPANKSAATKETGLFNISGVHLLQLVASVAPLLAASASVCASACQMEGVFRFQLFGGREPPLAAAAAAATAAAITSTCAGHSSSATERSNGGCTGERALPARARAAQNQQEATCWGQDGPEANTWQTSLAARPALVGFERRA